MFDVDEFVARCIDANSDGQPHLAVRDLLKETVSEPAALRGVFEDQPAGLKMLHRSADLTVISVVWAPRMRLYPHDHRMWAAIGIYAGREENSFYRRDRDRAVESGGKSLDEQDVALLGDDTIHSVFNPLHQHTAAIHVYGGDFVGTPRSQWNPDSMLEEPYDLKQAEREFERAEAAARAGLSDP